MEMKTMMIITTVGGVDDEGDYGEDNNNEADGIGKGSNDSKLNTRKGKGWPAGIHTGHHG
jgi:hypothetical protein